MKMRLGLGLSLAALCLVGATGCARRVIVVEPVPPPIVVSPLPPPVIVADDNIDYWCDGFRCYYYDEGFGQYFWWNGGVRIWLGYGWAPRPDWYHHDSGWRNRDHGWHGGDWERGHRPAAPGHGPTRGPGRGPGSGGRGPGSGGRPGGNGGHGGGGAGGHHGR